MAIPNDEDSGIPEMIYLTNATGDDSRSFDARMEAGEVGWSLYEFNPTTDHAYMRLLNIGNMGDLFVLAMREVSKRERRLHRLGQRLLEARRQLDNARFVRDQFKEMARNNRDEGEEFRRLVKNHGQLFTAFGDLVNVVFSSEAAMSDGRVADFIDQIVMDGDPTKLKLVSLEEDE